MPAPTLRTAVTEINRRGALLVFPLNNKKEPPSLWSAFYPRTKMVWEWTDDADDRVPLVWHLREKLSRSDSVVYVKWYQGRATFFSRELFAALAAPFAQSPNLADTLLPEARIMLEVLADNSPLPTKRLRMFSELQGKENESGFQKGIRQLSQRFLVVGYGEVEEGGFPSLAVGATELLFEDLWEEAKHMTREEWTDRVGRILPEDSLFLRHYRKVVTLVDPNFFFR